MAHSLDRPCIPVARLGARLLGFGLQLCSFAGPDVLTLGLATAGRLALDGRRSLVALLAYSNRHHSGFWRPKPIDRYPPIGTHPEIMPAKRSPKAADHKVRWSAPRLLHEVSPDESGASNKLIAKVGQAPGFPHFPPERPRRQVVLAVRAGALAGS